MEQGISYPSSSTPHSKSFFTIDQQARFGPKWGEQACNTVLCKHMNKPHTEPPPASMLITALLLSKPSLIFRVGMQLKPLSPCDSLPFSCDILFFPLYNLHTKLLPCCFVHTDCQYCMPLLPFTCIIKYKFSSYSPVCLHFWGMYTSNKTFKPPLHFP